MLTQDGRPSLTESPSPRETRAVTLARLGVGHILVTAYRGQGWAHGGQGTAGDPARAQQIWSAHWVLPQHPRPSPWRPLSGCSGSLWSRGEADDAAGLGQPEGGTWTSSQRWTASWGCADKVAKTRQLETTETDSLTVLQIRSPTSRCLGGRESVPGRSPSSGGVLATTCVPWLLPCSLILGDGSFKASPHLCLHVHRYLPVCVCVHTSSPFQTPVLWG